MVTLCEACHGKVHKVGDTWYHDVDWKVDETFYQVYLETPAREVKEYEEEDIIPSTVGAANYHTGNKPPTRNDHRSSGSRRRSSDDSGAVRGMPGTSF